MAAATAAWAFPKARMEGWWPEASAEADQALGALLANGLPHATDTAGEPLLDPADVFNTLTWAGQNGEDNLWRRRRMIAIVNDLGARSRTTVGRADGASAFRLSSSRTFDLTGCARGQAITLRLPLPLDGPDHRLIGLDASACRTSGAGARVADGRLETRFVFTGETKVTLAADIELAAGDGPCHVGGLDDEHRRLWLRPMEGFAMVTPRMAALAEHLAGSKRDQDAVSAFWDHLIRSFCLGVVRYDAFRPETALDWALDHGWFDCQIGCALLVALCRARGIPARLVGGNFLYRTYPSNHFWAEVWLEDEGWRSIDLTSWSLSLGGELRDWRDRFFLRLEPRLVTQRMPRQITGPSSIKFPQRWQMLQMQTSDGLSIGYTDVESGALTWEDRISVQWPDPPSPADRMGSASTQERAV
jgi:hypothetical protein